MSALICSRCGADVQKRYVGGLPVYRHTVPNFDHAPMPLETAWGSADARKPVLPVPAAPQSPSRPRVTPETA